MPGTTTSLIQLHLAMLMLGMTALFAKFIQLPPHPIICFRSFLAAVTIFCFIKLSKKTLRLHSGKDAFGLLTMGLLLSVHWVTYFYSLQISTIAIGTISLFTFPVMTSLLEPMVNRERFSLSDMIAALAVLAGVTLIVPEFNFSNQTTQGILWGIFSALLFSFRNILNRKYIQRYDGSVIMFYQCVITAVSILPFLSLQTYQSAVDDIYRILLLGVVFTAIPHTLFTMSMSTLKATSVGIIASLQPVYSTIFAFFLLQETPTLRTGIGGGIILFTSIYESVKHTRQTRKQHQECDAPID